MHLHRLFYNCFLENNYPKAGKINIVITEPKLFDGVYSLSVWFGNSYEESVKVLDALTFEVAGMSNKKQLDFQKVGSVVPITKWKFYN